MNKKIIYFVCLLLIVSSCKKTEELRFDTGLTALNIWLGTDIRNPDSIVYNYAYKSLAQQDTINFTARLVGVPVNEEREFSLKAVSGDTNRIKEGKHYDFPVFKLKANGTAGTFPIYIKRSSDFKTSPAKITFALKEDANFKKGSIENSKLTIILMEQFSKPINWDVDPLPFFKLSSFFGIYSNVKFQFITTIIGRAPTFKVRYSGTLLPPDEVSYTQAQYWQNRCKVELAKYNNEHPGIPLLSENNELITFP